MDRIKKFEPFFGEWYAESFIGAGSFGRVYKIYREELGERFYSALKYISIPSDSGEITQLRSDGMDNESISTYYADMAKDISSEITLMNRLRGNTNIVSFEDSKVVPKPDGMGYDIFIRMELLQSLTARMVDSPLSREETVRLGIDICNALVRCKKNGIIHRDIKPDNIFISPDGDFKLGDFGIARQLEKTATFMSKKGTYNYMAPEVYKGEKYGATCDLYSLGLVMYRLLNRSRLPFLPTAANRITANDREEALRRRFTGEALPAPCDADDALSEIVLKACAYEPKDRFASAAEMKEALLAYNRGEYVPAPVPEDKWEETQDLYGGHENGLPGVPVGFGPETTNTDNTSHMFPDGEVPGNHTISLKPWEKEASDGGSAPKPGPEKMPEEGPIKEIGNEKPIPIERQQPEPNSEKDDGKKKRVLWIAGIAAVLALAVGLCAALGVFGNNSKLPNDKAAMNVATGAPDAVDTPSSEYSDKPLVTSDSTATDTDLPTPTPIPAIITGISIATRPNTTSYYVNDTLDTSGLSINVVYSNGTSETVTSGFSCSPTTLSNPGNQSITVSYGEQTASFNVTVEAVSVSSITVESAPNKTVYYTGETLDASGLRIKVYYNDGTSETVTSGFSCSPTSLNTAGTQKISVSYGGKTVTFDVTVTEISISSISIATKPGITSYHVGDTLNTSGLSINVVYNNGTSETVSSGFSCSPTTLNTAGTQRITVSYGGKTTSFEVTVTAVSISNISIATYPNTTSYYVGDTLNTSGLSIDVYYNNGTTERKSTGFSCSPTTLNTAGTQRITVSYGGKTTSFEVTVTEISVSSITVESMPNCTSYYIGETLNTTGLRLKVNYNNGSSETVSSGFSCYPTTLNSAGTQNITVSYNNKNTSFRVSVYTPSITLSAYNESKRMNCWDSYWNNTRRVPLWKLYLPTISHSPSGGSVSWSFVRGSDSAYLGNGYIAAQQPGMYIVRATYTYCGYTYSADYTVTLSIYKTCTDVNYLNDNPWLGANYVETVPNGATVDITEVYWDADVHDSNHIYYLWGKTRYNGHSGWIVIS